MTVHPGSQETYDYISDWIAPNFFFSKKDLWDRMGMLGVFGDYALSCTQGEILEIGVGESSIYLTALARKYNRRIYHCDISASKIDNPLTVKGYLDPERGVFVRDTSDKFFKMDLPPIALGFIDGDHDFEQAVKDFWNLLLIVVDDGYIFLHDTFPPSKEYLDENHCGGVYKLRQIIEGNSNLDCLTLTRGAAMGVGLTICRKRPKNLSFYQR